MNRVVKYLYLLLIILIIPLNSLAGTPYTYEFLKLGGGARALGMGGAFVAIADDATAGYWNPAGLALLKKKEVTFMANNIGNIGNPAFGIKHHYLTGGMPTKLGGFGFSIIYLDVDDIIRTEADKYGDIVKLGTFKDTETGFIFSYGKEIFSDMLWVGISGKYIHHKLDTHTGKGYGIDIGMLNNLNSIFRWRWLPENTTLGTIFHIYTPKDWKGHKDSGFKSGELGLSTELFSRENSKLLLGLSLERGAEYPLIASIGGEWEWEMKKGNKIFIRSGIDNWYLEWLGSGDRKVSTNKLNYARKFSFGLGIVWNPGIVVDECQIDGVIFPQGVLDNNRFETNSQVSFTARF